MSIDPSAHLSPDLFQAREHFRGSSETRGARLDSHEIATKSLGGESLSIEVAYLTFRVLCLSVSWLLSAAAVCSAA